MNSSNAKSDPEVLIVGAGPVGLMMACSLARNGIAARIIDADAGPTDQSRALGIQARTLEVLDYLGATATMIQRGRTLEGVTLYAEKRHLADVQMDLDAQETRHPYALILPQSETERILEATLPDWGGGRVERRTALKSIRPDSDGVTAILVDPEGKESETRARWLIGCDGARSLVRKSLGIAFEGGEYEEGFILADVRLAWDRPDHRITVVLTPDGPVVGFPLPEPGRWRLVKGTENTLRPEDATDERVTDRFRDLIHEHFQADAKISDTTWTSAFRIHHRVAQHLHVGRCFLAGDAAHIHSPAGGQGMNTGIQDAFNLAWKLALVIRGESPGSLLDSYEAERAPIAAGVVRATHLMTRMITLHDPLAQGLRNRMLPLVVVIPPVRHRLIQGLSELAVHYPDSPIVAEDWPRSWSPIASSRGKGPRPGDRVPDLILNAIGNFTREVRLHDFFRRPEHTLLLFLAGDPVEDEPFWAVRQLVTDDHAGRIEVINVIIGSKEPDHLDDILLVADDQLHDRFGAGSTPCLYLIRPDGYVGYRAMPPDAAGLAEYLRRIFVSSSRQPPR